MLLIGGYCGIVTFLEVEYWQLPDDSHVKNISIILLEITYAFLD
jgi:putative membrane protein